MLKNNKMGKSNNKLALCLLFVSLLSFLATGAYIFYNMEYINNPLIKDNPEPLDFKHMYDLYITFKPDIYDRSYYGNPNASVTMVAFLDKETESSEYFFDSIFPRLEEEFIKTGKIKFYFKHYLTIGDIAQKNNKFLYAAHLVCIESMKKEAYYQFYLDMLELNKTRQISVLMANYNIPKESMNKCLRENSFFEIKMDALEIENFGISGMSPRFYIGIDGRDNTVFDGIPQYSKFNKTIRQYEFSIGN